MKSVKSVDEYIAKAPESVRPMVRELRATIKAAAPNAEERISYGIVGYFQKGKLIYFGIFRDHIGMYPLREGELPEMEKYRVSKGTASFPLDKKLPLELIKKWVKVRVKRNLYPQSEKDAHGTERNQIVSIVEAPEFPGFTFPEDTA